MSVGTEDGWMTSSYDLKPYEMYQVFDCREKEDGCPGLLVGAEQPRHAVKTMHHNFIRMT